MHRNELQNTFIAKLYCIEVHKQLTKYNHYKSDINAIKVNRVYILLLYTRLKAVFSRCEDVVKDRNTNDHLAWTAENGDSLHGGYPAHGNSKSEI